MKKLPGWIAQLETSANWISDMDREWWPFLFMRPARNHRMSTLRVAAIAGLYGVFTGMVGNLVAVLMGERLTSPYIFPLALTMVFFGLYRLTFAYAWNRRAVEASHDTDPHIDTD